MQVHRWVGCVVLCALAGAAPVQAAPNGLDSTFGDHGKVTTDFGGLPDSATAMVIQPDGKIVAVGDADSQEPGPPFSALDFAVARYRPDGRLDETFGGDGTVTTDVLDVCNVDPFEFCGTDLAEAVALQADGRIVVAGHTQIRGYDLTKAPINTDIALVRYNADGTLDSTFGGDGRVTTDIVGSPDPFEPSQDGARSVAIQGDGKILIAGYTRSGLVLVRYEPDGTRDPNFGDDGIIVYGDRAYPIGMALQADGRIVVTANTPTGFVLARYTATGARDSTFGADGKVQIDATSAVAIAPGGRIVLAGTRDSQDGGDFELARYNADGTPDAGFGDNGKVRTDFLDADSAHAVAIQPDGGIVAAGAATTATTREGGFALARYRADGTLDASGSDDGRTITDFPNPDPADTSLSGDARPSANAVAIQPDGRVVLAGFTGFIPCTCFPSDFAIARYEAHGSFRLDAPGHREVHPCVNGSFVDLNALLGVDDPLTCARTIMSGQYWRPLAFWYVGDIHYAVPPGYQPVADTPLKDLLAKLRSVKVVVDGGTLRERTTAFKPADVLRADLTLDQFYQPFDDVWPFPMAITLPLMKPLNVGQHTVEVVWVLNAMHCDGLGESATDNCLPAGDAPFGRQTITVAHP